MIHQTVFVNFTSFIFERAPRAGLHIVVALGLTSACGESSSRPTVPDPSASADTSVPTDAGPSEAGPTDASGPFPVNDADAVPRDPECVELLAGGDGWTLQLPLRNYWRDDRGLHWVGVRNRDPDRLVLQTHDPATGELSYMASYPVLDFDRGGPTLGGVARSHDGTLALSFSGRVEGDVFLHQFVLLTSLADLVTYEVVELPWDLDLRPEARFIAWDGEAFAWHGLVLQDGVYQLAIGRFREDGTVLLPLTLVGSPSTRIWNGYDMVTDSATGTTWMTAPGGGGSRVTGTHRDGTPLTEDGTPRIIGDIDRPGPPDAAHVSLGPPGQAMFTFSLSYDGLIAQLVDERLDELGPPIQIKNERVYTPDAFRDFFEGESAAAFAEDQWWIFSENGLGVRAHRVEDDSVTETIEVVHFSARDIGTATGDFPDLMHVGKFSTFVHADEIWLGIEDWSAEQLGGPILFRVMRFKPGCVYDSLYDRWLAGERF